MREREHEGTMRKRVCEWQIGRIELVLTTFELERVSG